MNEKDRKNREELLRLINENADLPVVPMVNGEVVAGDEYGWWLGSWGSAKLDEWLLSKNDEVIFKSESDVFYTLEKCMDSEEFERLPETEKECRPFYDALPWKKAIVVYINAAN